MTSVAEVLREARSLVDTPEKWAQREFWTASGARCMSQAIADAQHAQGSANADEPAYWLLRRTLGGVPLSRWNDAPERTHADVLAAFDKAIALAEAEEASCIPR